MKLSKVIPTILFNCVLVLLVLNLLSCAEKESEPAPAPTPEATPPPVWNSKIQKSVYPASAGTIKVQDSVIVYFNEVPNRTKVIENVKYRAKLDEVAISGVTTTAKWASDSLSVVLFPVDMLKGATTFQISVKAHWEVYDKAAWSIVTWQGTEARETVNSSFTTLAAALKIESANIEYRYPIADQYHFLKNEHPFCFVKLVRGQESLFTTAGYTFLAVFTDGNGQTLESSVSYDAPNRLIKFAPPGSLQPQTIYTLKLIARSTGSGETILVPSYPFRTSKFDTFAQKIATLTLGFTGSYADTNPYDERLFARITSLGEFFDSFEGSTDVEEFGTGTDTYGVTYCTGLVRVEWVAAGTDWYTTKLYPLVYAPWTHANFKPVLSRSTAVISSPPAQAAYFSASGTGKLTPEMVAANSAPPLASGTTPEMILRPEFTTYKDFLKIQSQVVQAYINSSNVPERELRVLVGVFPRYTGGNYNYAMKYVLPSGEVTSSVSGSFKY